MATRTRNGSNGTALSRAIAFDPRLVLDEAQAVTAAAESIAEIATEGSDRAAEQVRASVSHMATAVRTVSRDAEGLSTSVEQTAASLTEIAASIRGVSGNADDLAAAAEETASSINEMAASIEEVGAMTENLS